MPFGHLSLSVSTAVTCQFCHQATWEGGFACMFAMLLCPYLVTRTHLFACVPCTPFHAGLCTLSHTRNNPAWWPGHAGSHSCRATVLPPGSLGPLLCTPAISHCHQEEAWACLSTHLLFPFLQHGVSWAHLLAHPTSPGVAVRQPRHAGSHPCCVPVPVLGCRSHIC